MTDTDPHVLQPGHAPTPFTADEIRAGCPSGRNIHVLVEPADAEPYLRVIRFINTKGAGAEQEVQNFTRNGEPHGPAGRLRSSWSDLQSHASFPASNTVIDDDEIEVPAGRFDCVRYTVTDGRTVDTFWFARALPGMPVKVVSQQGGRMTTVMTMLETVTPD